MSGRSGLSLIVKSALVLMCSLLISDVALAQPARGNGTVLISEFRLRGPNGATDEFIELYNNTDNDITVTDTNINPVNCALLIPCGWAIVDITNVFTPRFVIPIGTIIRKRSHFLITNSSGYSLGTYASADTVNLVTPASYTTDIPDETALALFNTADASAFNLTHVIDAVGNSGFSELYVEGTGLSPICDNNTSNCDGLNPQYSWVRRLMSGRPQDTGNNAADFILVETSAQTFPGSAVTNFATVASILGAPGPQNQSSPVARNSSFSITTPNSGTLRERYDNCAALPARLTSAGISCGSGSALGFLSLRRRVVNNTGQAVTQLRFRIVDMTTLNYAPPGFVGPADVRIFTAPGDGTISLLPTTLDELNAAPPSQPNGGAMNSTVRAGTITMGSTLANGAGIDLEFLLGVQTTGNYRFLVNVEALPAAP